ncbi:MAG: SCO family protein [Vicingus serpentipes]|nr:SCO family protein [Vicingus serpentipes]
MAILLLPATIYLLLSTGQHHFNRLPYYGPREAFLNESGKYDTNYHKIPYFEFVNQDGNKVSSNDLLGNIYIADFFFVTCPTICPKMTTNMGYIQQKFNGKDDLKFISITVNPEHDNIDVLKEYAKKVHADIKSWSFLTGEKEKIYDIAFNGFFVSTMRDSIAPGGFLHSQMLILVDRKGHVRGYFDGTVYSEMKKDLTDAIDILYKEDIVPLKGSKKEKIEQKRKH